MYSANRDTANKRHKRLHSYPLFSYVDSVISLFDPLLTIKFRHVSNHTANKQYGRLWFFYSVNERYTYVVNASLSFFCFLLRTSFVLWRRVHEICRSYLIFFENLLFLRAICQGAISLLGLFSYIYVRRRYAWAGAGWIHDHGCQCSGLLADCRYPRFFINVYVFNSMSMFSIPSWRF